MAKEIFKEVLNISAISCKKCNSDHFVKCGHIDGHQRCKCKDCGMQFTQCARRGVDPVAKGLAIFLYSYCGMSMSKIAKLFAVSVVAVLKWIRKAAYGLPNHKDDVKSAKIVMLDEIWHFVNGKKEDMDLASHPWDITSISRMANRYSW